MKAYQFPKIAKLEDMTPEQLGAKLYEEADECVAAMKMYDGGRNRLDLVMETLDVIHVCETILHHFDVDYAELEDGINFVTLKNKLRGYYEEDNRDRNERNTTQRY